MVGGGLSVGFGILETAVKEAAEEASVPPNLASTMKPVGCVRYVLSLYIHTYVNNVDSGLYFLYFYVVILVFILKVREDFSLILNLYMIWNFQ